MRKCLVVLCAMVTVVAVSGMAGASPMDLLNWQTYDSFNGPSLNLGLWRVEQETNMTYAVESGLSLSSTSTQHFGISSTLSLNSTDSFAVKIPFNISSASGQLVHVGLDLEQNNWPDPSVDVMVAWAKGDGTGTPPINGQVFASGSSPGNGPPTEFNFIATPATQGQLGFIYDGTTFFGYYDDGSGWQMLYSGSPGWSGSLLLHLSADSAGDFSALVSNLQIAAVPLPASLLLFGSGFIGLAGWRRFRKG